MTREELRQILNLQNRAFQLLMWIGRQARQRPELLSSESVEALKHADTCEDWLTQHDAGLPYHLRVAQGERRAFAYLLSSFFNTSFHVEQASIWNGWIREGSRPMLRPGLASSGGKGKAHRRRHSQKQLEVAGELQRLALASLAEENGHNLSREQSQRLASEPELAADLNVWSYAYELHRRSQFASQGAAVHRLWKAIEAEERTKLDADQIWQARERLAAAIQQLPEESD